ncbi:hypothetical protein PQBR44_0110 (plasmid) [Pseudomonas putida UWC1]|nr:hypothetical protein PQBR44_0110 [Pseudomonas putida UWC1]
MEKSFFNAASKIRCPEAFIWALAIRAMPLLDHGPVPNQFF